ncbi:MAG: hypothetical protein ACRD2O_14985, partial [Terriglobia bacterium]
MIYVNLILPIFTLVIGAVLTHFLSRSSADRLHAADLPTQAYVDLPGGMARIATAQKRVDTPGEAEGLARITDAKLRICVYGKKRVVGLVANFFRERPVLDNPESSRRL